VAGDGHTPYIETPPWNSAYITPPFVFEPFPVYNVLFTMWLEWFFDVIGKVIFPRQQDWERRRNTKVMTAAVTVGLFLGLVLWKVLQMMNQIRK
jgi:hypothetical protein